MAGQREHVNKPFRENIVDTKVFQIHCT